MDMIHISAVRQLLATGAVVTLRVLTAKGELREYKECTSLKYNHRAGCRNIKLVRSGEIRKIKDVLIVGLNDMEVYI